MRSLACSRFRACGAAVYISVFVALSTSDARAFCRAITQEPPAGYDPAVSGCYLGDGGLAYSVYWKNLCVSYSMQRDASTQISLADAKSVAAQAFSAWSNATCSGGAGPAITVSEAEPPGDEGVSCDEVQYNPYGPNQNLIVFRDQGWPDEGDSVNTLGLTTVTFDATDGEIYDADMEINSHDFQLVPFPPAPANGYDLLSVVTHEAGHFLGLAHSADSSAVMYAFYHPGSTTLRPDDVNGICSIYPPDGTRTTSAGPAAGEACCPVPRHGLASTCAPEDATGKVSAAGDASEEPLVAPCGAETDAGAGMPTPAQSHGGGCSMTPGLPDGESLGDTATARALFVLGIGFLGRRRRRRSHTSPR